jgi:hypothetical protein
MIYYTSGENKAKRKEEKGKNQVKRKKDKSKEES